MLPCSIFTSLVNLHKYLAMCSQNMFLYRAVLAIWLKEVHAQYHKWIRSDGAIQHGNILMQIISLKLYIHKLQTWSLEIIYFLKKLLVEFNYFLLLLEMRSVQLLFAQWFSIYRQNMFWFHREVSAGAKREHLSPSTYWSKYSYRGLAFLGQSRAEQSRRIV